MIMYIYGDFIVLLQYSLVRPEMTVIVSPYSVYDIKVPLSHSLSIEHASPCPTLILSSARLGGDKARHSR